MFEGLAEPKPRTQGSVWVQTGPRPVYMLHCSFNLLRYQKALVHIAAICLDLLGVGQKSLKTCSDLDFSTWPIRPVTGPCMRTLDTRIEGFHSF